MTTIERLLVAVDASPSGQFASRLVGLLAGARHIPTTVLHFDYEQEAAPQVGAEQARRTEAVVEASADEGEEAGPSEPGTEPVEIVTKVERPDEGTIRAEASNGYDFLMIGREPASEGPRFHDQILRSAAAFDGPFGIAIARGPDRAEGPGRPFNILVPVTETHVLGARRGDGDRLGASVTRDGYRVACHGCSPDAAFPAAPDRCRGRSERRSEAMIREIVKMGETHGVEVRSAVHGGGAVSSEILRQVKAGDHNLLVIGVETRPGQGLAFGDVPAELLAHCDCSILFVVSEPPGSAGELQESRAAVPGGIDNAPRRTALVQAD